MSKELWGQAPMESLDPGEVAPLFSGLHDSSAEVRIATLEALTRLPLAPSDWMKLGAFVAWVLQPASPLDERLAVVDIARWIPLRPVRKLLVRLAAEGEGEEVRARAEAAARSLRTMPERAPSEGTPLRPGWAEGPLPGFTTYSASALAGVRAELARILPSFEQDPRDFELLPMWTINERIMAPVLEHGLAPAAVTVLFEKASDHKLYWILGNHIVGWVQEIQGRFRPDLDGLFVTYWRLSVKQDFIWTDSENRFRALCWQIGWTASRGGLHGLVPGLVAHLSSADRSKRVAAAFMISDVADYILQPDAPLFGGGFAPDRQAYEPLPGYGELVPFDQYICPRGDYRWPILGIDDPVVPPQECPVHHLRLVFQRAGTGAT